MRYLAAEAGIRQFLDIGSGLPTTANVHEIAQAVAPSCRVVYVDNDPMVLAHARALLTSAPEGRTAYIQADLRSPLDILASPAGAGRARLRQAGRADAGRGAALPAGRRQAGEVIATLLDALPPGSYLAASHMTMEHDPEAVGGGQRAYREAGLPMNTRDADDFASLAFSGLDLVPPGVVLVSEWRPDTNGPRPTPGRGVLLRRRRPQAVGGREAGDGADALDVGEPFRVGRGERGDVQRRDPDSRNAASRSAT